MAGIVPIGLTERGTNRLAWTSEDAAAAEWFGEQAAEIGLTAVRDPAGNLWACPDRPPPWWGVGSHLDSVRDGGRFDGALGVAAAFEIAARSSRPVAVISFADEEGARFNTPTFGSRALAGILDVETTLARTDDDGVPLRVALADAGVDPAGVSAAPEWIRRLRGFIELHIDQTRELQAAGFAVGVVSALAARTRVAATVHGAADHAGTTRGRERHDALHAAAKLIVAAHAEAGHDHDLVITCGRILVEPNALTTVAGSVRLWLDARASVREVVVGWRERVDEAAAAVARETQVRIALETQSDSAPTEFDETVRRALRQSAGDAPEVVCFAGHDAGMLAARVPAGMLLVRNPTGVSHSANEQVDLADAAVGATAITTALDGLA